MGDTQKLVAHYANKLVLERGDADEIKYKYNYDVHEYPENDTFVKVYDYILNNADSKNIAHVFGLGDITERASVWEWVQKGCPYAPDEEFSIAVEQFMRMKAAGLDFSLVRGNHESWDIYNKYLGTGEASGELGYADLVDEVYVHPNGTVDYTNSIHYFSAGNRQPTDPEDPANPEEPEKLNFFQRIWRAIVNFFRRLFGIKEN